jgi:hypothetical protein
VVCHNDSGKVGHTGSPAGPLALEQSLFGPESGTFLVERVVLTSERAFFSLKRREKESPTAVSVVSRGVSGD